MQMYKYETGYDIHTFEDRTRGLRSRTSVVNEDEVIADLRVM